ncbi:MAG: glycosyltransferase family 2 protein [Planctomycetia bacterium]|nr:glycosyltransferase family 2 protein [Planctomycetia bacterium]
MNADILNIIVVALYFAVLAVLSLAGIHRYAMVWLYYRHKEETPKPKIFFKELPPVTVQLPIFNEMYVAERLIDAVCRLDYPRHLLEIQVLDDSTDETVEIARKKVAEKRAEGFDIRFIHRTDRTGYKAGALENGLRHTKNEFVAVFDADFLPRADFLQQTIHFFANPHIGMVQARWEHINRDWSWLTKIQAIMLDAHFVLEHTARNRSGRFFNFNGTAGIWRKKAIEDGGGWQHDTLTEDLDLSYRSQLKGWEFVYLKDLASPSELPGDINAFKTQQHRWAKGGVQTALKLLPTIWSAKVPMKVKMEATHHLGNYVSFLGMVLVCLLILPSMIARQELGWLSDLKWADALVLIGAFCSVLVYYGASQIELGKGWAKRFLLFPLMLAVGVGMCLNNAKAVMEALLGHQTGFVRTPKHGLATKGGSLTGKKYRSKWNVLAVVELIFGVYFTAVCAFAWHFEMWGALPFLALFPIGFFYVSGLSFLQAFGAKPKPVAALAAVAEKQTAA